MGLRRRGWDFGLASFLYSRVCIYLASLGRMRRTFVHSISHSLNVASRVSRCLLLGLNPLIDYKTCHGPSFLDKRMRSNPI